MSFFTDIRTQIRSSTLKVLAELTSRFNSQYRAELDFTDLYSGKSLVLGISSQFMPVYYRFDQMKISVACWKIEIENLKMMEGLSVDIYQADQLNQFGQINLYLPVDYFSYFSKLMSQLPPPAEYYDGYLTPSGRTLWLFNRAGENQHQQPVCIKINTHFIKSHEQFTVKPFLPSQAKHSVCVSEYLKNFNQTFSEDFALKIRQVGGVDENENIHLYVERQIDFAKCGIGLKDFLAPLHAVCGPVFWSDPKIQELYGLNAESKVFFFEEDWPRELARLVRRSLDEIFLHFELHQQNLTAHIRNGRLKQLLYHDLLDTSFDPITYFLYSSESHETKLITIKHMTSNALFNSFGEIYNSERKIKDFTVGSIYRRYLRNFGDFTRVYNLFSEKDFLSDQSFEKKVLEYLNFSEADLSLQDYSSMPLADIGFAKDDLFWSIERYFYCKQQRGIKDLKVTALQQIKKQTVSDSDVLKIFEKKYLSQQGFVSAGFPCRQKHYKPDHLRQLQMSQDEKIFWGRYASMEFLIIFNS